MKEDEITWQTIIYDLIKTKQINPWDVDISKLASEYIEIVRKLQETNLFVSGKVLLAAALLLRIKSNKLVAEDILLLDSILYPKEDEIYEELEEYERPLVDIPKLAIKTPQARKRRISINDLINALQGALEVNKRKVLRRIEAGKIDVEIPERRVDITMLIKQIYDKIIEFFKKKERVTFADLVTSERKEDKIHIFIPLLYLDTQARITLQQKEHFGEIEILQYR